MTDIERAIIEKAIEKIDMDALTDKIAEIVADRIIKKEFPSIPTGIPWTAPPRPIDNVVVMYGCNPVGDGFSAYDASVTVKKNSQFSKTGDL